MFLVKHLSDHEFWANASYPRRVYGLWGNYLALVAAIGGIVLLLVSNSAYATVPIAINVVSIIGNCIGIALFERNAANHRERARVEARDRQRFEQFARRTNMKSVPYQVLAKHVRDVPVNSDMSTQPLGDKLAVCLRHPEPDQEEAINGYFARTAAIMAAASAVHEDDAAYAEALTAVDTHAETLADQLRFIEKHRIATIDSELEVERARVRAAIDRSYQP